MGLILVDTSIWVDHIRHSLVGLADLIRDERCVMHPYVLSEIALGSLPERAKRLGQLRALPSVQPLDHDTFLDQIERLELQGSGLGMVDAHLLATVALTSGLKLWSRDRRLAARAAIAGLGWAPGNGR